MSDEMNVRKINELDVVDAIPAGSSLLINDGGEAKLLPTSLLDAVIPLVVTIDYDADTETWSADVPYETLKARLLANGAVTVKVTDNVGEPFDKIQVGGNSTNEDGTYINDIYYGLEHKVCLAKSWDITVANKKITAIDKYTVIEFAMFYNERDGALIYLYYDADGTLTVA